MFIQGNYEPFYKKGILCNTSYTNEQRQCAWVCKQLRNNKLLENIHYET